MTDYDSLFANLAAAGVTVRGLRQTHSQKWEAQLHLAHKGREIERLACGPSAYHALVNCFSVIEWSRLNPPKPSSLAKGSLDELLALTGAMSKYVPPTDPKL